MNGLNRPIDSANGLKLLGERNSGTNVLEQLLQKIPDLQLYPSLPMLTWRDVAKFSRPWRALWNYRAAHEQTLDAWHLRDLPHTGGWKHAAPDEAFRDRFLNTHRPAVLIITRHPVSWLRSMHRNPFHTLTTVPTDFSTFIRQHWLCTHRDGLQPCELPDVLALYEAKLSAYAVLLNAYDNSALIRYEDLIQDPKSFLSRLGLPCPDDLQLPLTDPRPFATPRSTDTFASIVPPSFNDLPPSDRDFVRNRLAQGTAHALYAT
ncbi:MAG: hypothetical protein ACU0A6_17815 [Shimia sp.]|uniref:hypothetical protein n=1 Tax=Shimia sp. TaxID=1954381 RepID=UPI004059D59F